MGQRCLNVRTTINCRTLHVGSSIITPSFELLQTATNCIKLENKTQYWPNAGPSSQAVDHNVNNFR